MGGVWHVLTRRKVLDESADILKHNRLSRQLGTGDLIALGVGSTLGLGVYVLAGHVAKDFAGPSVILSFFIAALASLFAGLCYAEFGARVPRAGSAYVYSYVCVGEFIAFIIGWNLILEYVIGSASVSRGISLYLDTLLNDTIKNTFKEIAPINVSFLSDYFDLFAFGLAFFLGVFLAFGMKESTRVNNVFTVLNICIVLFVIIAGSVKADVNNWYISPENVSPSFNVGAGGFFPFGFAGTLKGAATCFFGFVGFDCIATTGEEVHNPKRAIPVSIVTSLAIIFLAYFGISTVLTLMWPYYLQNADAPIPFVFGEVGWEWAKWIVAIGGIFGLLSSLFGSMFPLPRILYAMASDGLVFKFFGTVSPRFKSPVMGTILASLLTGTMAGLFELSHLVNMMSIGTLMAYTIVAACVLLLRFNCGFVHDDEYETKCAYDTDESYSLLDAAYSDDEDENGLYVSALKDIFEREVPTLKGEVLQHESSYLMNQNEKFSISKTVKQLFNCHLSADPSRLSSIIVGSLITLYCIFCIAFSLSLIYLIDDLYVGTVWAVVLTSIFGGLMLLCMLFIALQPKSKTELTFEVPLVPLVPCISIFVNIYLMLMLDVYTWIRFGIWMAVGLPIYLISLFIYERGGNYLMHTQKSSINGKMSGNLNYAFENMAECQERVVSFVPDVKIFVQSPTPPNTKASLAREGTRDLMEMEESKEIRQNGYPRHEQQITIRELQKKEDSAVITDDLDEITDAKRILRDSFREIELLDQVLKDEEEASQFAALEPDNEIEDIPYQNIPLNPRDSQPGDPIPDTTPDIDYVLSNGEGAESLVVSSEQNVVVLVHRENDQQKPAKRTISMNSGVMPDGNEDEDNVSTVNEDVNLRKDSLTSDFSSDKNPDVIAEEPSVFIPKPPPMDMLYLSAKPRTLPIIRYVRKPREKEPEPDYDDAEDDQEDEDDDASGQLKAGTSQRATFINKLNILLLKQKGVSNVTAGKLQRSRSSNALENEEIIVEPSFRDIKEKRKSEPSIIAALKTELLQKTAEKQHHVASASGSYIDINDKKDFSSPKNISPLNSRKVSLTDKTEIKPNQNNDNTKIRNPGDPKKPLEIKTLTKKDLRLKLESILAAGPQLPFPRSSRRLTAKSYIDITKFDSDLESEPIEDSREDETDEIIKPIPKENYSNTMKLQRARFGDVLKSIQFNNSRRGSTTSDFESNVDHNGKQKVTQKEVQ